MTYDIAVMTDKCSKLRFMTYLSPGIPIELFETIMHYIEEITGCETHLIYESRWSSPPAERTDPFTTNDADIGFMCTSGFLSLLEKKNPYVQLCKYAPLHVHDKSENRPVYFSDLIINSENKATYKEFHDLRGHIFAYNEETSLSGCLVVLAELKRMGFNSSFFGNTLKSGGHLQSIEMILNNTADIAAIDSNTLHYYLKQNPHNRDKLTVLKSFGPLPVYPIIFNNRIPEDLRQQVSEALRDVDKHPVWQKKLQALGLAGFAPVDQDHYNQERDLVESVKSLSVASAYY